MAASSETSISPAATPAAMGVDPGRLRDYITALDGQGCHSLVVLRGGKTVVEAWWRPYRREYGHILYSVTKSFVSVAAGFAVQEGLLSVDERLVDVFPEALPCAPCAFMREATVGHLLTMTLGHRGRTDLDFYRCDDWVAETLRLYLETKPGTDFFYDNRCTNLVAAILHKRAGTPLREYLRPRLFEPLGIASAEWEVSPFGWNTGGWGLSMTTGDLARFGQFLLNGGSWGGKQLLDPAWIAVATGNHADTRHKSVLATEDCWRGYGYFFWQSPFPNAYRGDGALGQTVIVMPDQDMVVAMTAGTNTRGDLLKSTWDILCPAIDAPIADAAANQERLDALVASLELPPARGSAVPPGNMASRSGAVHRMAENPFGITGISAVFGDTDRIRLRVGDDWREIAAGHGRWVESRLDGLASTSHIEQVFYPDVAASAAWDGDEYVVKLAFTRTPYTDTIRLRFDDSGATGEYRCYPVFPMRGDRADLMGRPER